MSVFYPCAKLCCVWLSYVLNKTDLFLKIHRSIYKVLSYCEVKETNCSWCLAWYGWNKMNSFWKRWHCVHVTIAKPLWKGLELDSLESSEIFLDLCVFLRYIDIIQMSSYTMYCKRLNSSTKWYWRCELTIGVIPQSKYV